ncbi:threonylcarbamoyl-AMP synthase [Qipengyuania sp. 6B39]|uniref:L-threonylcarbamoyladenylate synthase n=1 Tax=Qipengyuania proteolytica TaxID=2867239 RepID=UPI001C89076F|nr:L-threonylcarbamoyladenylate synthase [Qipengyuania proteolytica]MBX7494607.1 threonylcarbamoyl-AMP synthase [Qipengyuania proteolytica]
MVGKYATETILADATGIARAARILRDGGLVAVPTETVYGLAARADDDAAVARIYEAKGRPSFNPLIVHVQSVEQARTHGAFNPTAEELARKYWPGPLTLVLPRCDDARLASSVSAGLPTVALRCPAHPVMRQLLAECAFPLAAPSANRSGFISPTTAGHVLASLDGRIDAILDGGPCKSGLESTIVAVRDDGRIEVLRPGPLDFGTTASADGIEAPGQLASHYAPSKPVRLDATEVAPDDFMIGFGAIGGDCTLSSSGSLTEAAARLYACLHEGARSEKPRIAVAPIPEEGIGIAINDRLRRAATPPD